MEVLACVDRSSLQTFGLNYLDTTTDPKSPLQILCAKHPDEAKEFKQLSGGLNKKLGSELWYSKSIAAMELIGLWRQHYQELKEQKKPRCQRVGKKRL